MNLTISTLVFAAGILPADADAKAARESLQAVLSDLKSPDTFTGDTPPE